MSKFLVLNRKRFESSMRDISGDYVPWHLDDKATAYAYVHSLGFEVPTSEKFDSIEGALSESSGRFVIKGAGGHSGKNVFVLEKLDEDLFLDLMGAKTWSFDAIRDAASKRPAPYWIREQCVESTVYGRTVPFDYKVDCFKGQVVTITQIDRNFWPPRVAVFDGAFVPLRPTVDYTLDPDRWMYAAPVLPIQASEMIRVARELSLSTGSKYVRVDLFDGFAAPVFGEFTFASGPPDARMIRFSDRVLAEFDRAVDGEEISSVSGFDIDYATYWADAAKSVGPLSVQHVSVLSRVAASASFGDHRYWKQIEVAPKGRMGAHYKFCLAVASAMAGSGDPLFSIQELIRVRAGFIRGNASEREYIDRALAFHHLRKDRGDWHVSRHAEVMARRGDKASLAELQAVADRGYEYAKRVVESLASSSGG